MGKVFALLLPVLVLLVEDCRQTTEAQQYHEQNVPWLCLRDCASFLPTHFFLSLFFDCIMICILPPKASMTPAVPNSFKKLPIWSPGIAYSSAHHVWRVLFAHIFGFDPAPKIIANSSSLPMLKGCLFSEVLPHKSFLRISHSSSN